MNGRNVFVVCFGVLAALWEGCFLAGGFQVQLEAAESRVVTPYAEVYQRSKVDFVQANFYKPLESGTNELTFTLAPLIIQEVESPGIQAQAQDEFGTVCSSNGIVSLDRSRPAVYFCADSVQFNGRAHARFGYVWFYSAATSQAGESSLPMQGVRLTLNTNGQPIVWEVLADTSGKELVFVSQNLEAAARAEFGKPLPGRKYAVERSLEETPNAMVARVIDDGPMPMGPIVYLKAETRCVSTVICRCMAAQAKKLVGTSMYELLPLSGFDSRLAGARVQSLVRRAFWPGDQPDEGKLARRLRLPTSF